MSYITGGNIQSADYNAFATLAGGMNEVYADLYPGATTLPTAAYGYGQTPALTTVSGTILATDWASLFSVMRKCGTHQGTIVTPPVPASGPLSGNDIAVFNTPSTMASIVALLGTNRHNLAVGQSTLISGTNYAQTGATIPWTNTLTWTCQVDFSSWNNARYFFNSGGFLGLNGSYSPISTPEDTQWDSMLTAMSPLVFNWNSTTPNTGTGGTSIGFYNLTTSYQTIYTKTFGGGGSYTNSYIQVQGKLNATAGTNGLVDFTIALIDADVTPNAKNGTTTYRVDNTKASGASISYPGPLVTVAVGANNGFVAT
jgi:hypothetical protein